MDGQSTEIRNPKNPKDKPKIFTFDYSYWSHDDFAEKPDGYFEPKTPKFADQQIVFNDLGLGVLDNAWKGYNTSLFAYGQTGSGKSYSMVGCGANKGIVPMVCEELFSAITEKRAEANEDEEYKVTFSMLEIYNEQVRDLLHPKSFEIKGGLKVRENAKGGFYVEDLKTVSVYSYGEIDSKINEGTTNRTIASTDMNATSSRAHTIVAINFTQKFLDYTGYSMTRTSVINLVDLAGSERAGAIGATGDRLKEGTGINQSLSSLGNCIQALAEISLKSGNKKRTDFVQFRESVLTKLLKNALGGNSKTIMVAALSPADINYAETLSTLRFADRAKAVKTLAVINECPTDKLIRELREENARLMGVLKSGDDLIEMVSEANAISEKLCKECKFELALPAPHVRGMKERTNEVCVRMRNVHNDTEFVWDRNKFFNRQLLMQKMFQKFANGDDWDLPMDRDPFWEDPNTEVYLGSVYVKLQPLANMTGLEESLQVSYNRGMEQGRLQVVMIPCAKDGKKLISKTVEEPEKLIGRDLFFKVKVQHARELPRRYSSTYCEYKMYQDEEMTTTKEAAGVNPEYGHEKQHTYHHVEKQFVDHLQHESLIIDIWGRQKARDVKRIVAVGASTDSQVSSADMGTMTTRSSTCVIL